MKKISIITILDNTNFGTYLQALALGIILKKRDYDVEIIDYHRQCTSLCWAIREAFKKNPLKALYNICYSIPLRFLLKHKNRNFLQSYLSYSPVRYTSYYMLKVNPPKADIYITGSDQVWNSIYNKGVDKAFYLDFVCLKNALKISYGASIGMDAFPENELEEVKSLISKYDYLSVREEQARRILHDIGFTNVVVVLDPTLLLTRDAWRKLISSAKFLKTEKYLLVYTVETHKENSIIEKISTEIALNRGYAIYNVSYNNIANKLNFCDRNYMNATPQLFFNLMYNADFVVVSSFHGTAFALNLNKDFLSVSPNKFNSRVNNILSLCELQNRLLLNSDFNFDKMEVIDYEKVNKVLDTERIKSFLYLDKVLGELKQ